MRKPPDHDWVHTYPLQLMPALRSGQTTHLLTPAGTHELVAALIRALRVVSGEIP